MPINWLLDATVFDSYHDELAAEIIDQGHKLVTLNRPDPPYHWDDLKSSYQDAFAAGSCVVTHADIDLVNRVRRFGGWTPGAFATVEHFFCSHYYAHVGRFLLNDDYAMLPFAELPRCREFLFSKLGRDDRLFVRPDSPLKLFTGMAISRDTFDRDYEFMAFYDFPRESLVLVSSPKAIVSEWRFVVAGGNAVASSLYRSNGEDVAQAGADPDVTAFAEQVVATDFFPDPVWILDIARTREGRIGVLEIGGFSFSSLYGCDKQAVVSEVSRVAEEIHGQSATGGNQ